MSTDTEVLSQLDLCDPPQELLDYAKEELGEDPETRCQVLEEFRDLIFEKGECTPHRTDDSFLLRFLRARYFVVNAAHRLLVNYCDFKENNPEFFENVDLLHLNKIGDHKLLSVWPYREQTGRRILLYKFGLWDPAVFPIEEVFQASMIVLELAILEQRAQILGGICVFDLSGITMQQVLHMTPSVAKKMFQIMVTSFPMKIQAVHIVNQPWIFEIVFNIFKPWINQKMRERIFIHGDNMESLHKHINPKHLPEQYGGVHPEYDYKDWMDFFRSNEKVIWEVRSLGYTVEPVINNKTEK